MYAHLRSSLPTSDRLIAALLAVFAISSAFSGVIPGACALAAESESSATARSTENQESQLSSPATAPRRFSVGAGVLLHNALGEVAGYASGSANLFGTAYPAITLTGRFGQNDLRFAPSLSYAPPVQTDPDGAVRKSLVALTLSAEKSFSDLDLRAGAGMLFYILRGQGGTVVLDNGNNTRPFYLPERSSTSRLLYLDIGAGTALSRDRRIRLDLDNLLTGTFSRRLSLSWLLSLSYGV